MARISTHVLDTSKGSPARGITVELYFKGKLVSSALTNADGRTDAPLLSAARIETGNYELLFRVAEYLKSSGAPRTDPPFLNDITIRFGVADGEGNYHVPLLLAAHSYSTYRGS
jgi:5-hydroxyisourate hydrolase